MRYAHVYDLSFVAPNRKLRTKPQLVFSIHERHLGGLVERLNTLSKIYTKHAAGYFRKDVPFRLPTPDLYGNIEFGYGACGFVTKEDSLTQFRLELSEKNVLRCTLTLHLLSSSLLNLVYTGDQPSNHDQSVILNTVCDYTKDFYQHAVGGSVSWEIREWLKQRAKRAGRDRQENAPLPKVVIQAMKQAWRAVNDNEMGAWSSSCRGLATKDGRFGLECFGNACDVAIYPDQVWSSRLKEQPFTEFGCHNLDSPAQQLTLVAGLAKIAELARSSRIGTKPRT